MTLTAESPDGNRGDWNAFTAEVGAAALASRRQQFQSQRELFECKTRDFWLSTINSHRSDPSKLWDDINTLLQPPVVAPTLHTAMDHATFFRSTIERIRASTAGASAASD
jgi:hypothetical protein